MLFASLFASALSVLGSVTAAPLEVGAEVQIGAHPVNYTAEHTLLPRAESEELKAFVENIEDNFTESDEKYITRIMNACTRQWPDHNVFVFHKFRDFSWGTDNPEATKETSATHHYLFWHNKYFQVVVFKCGGFVEKLSGDGGGGNWQVWGHYTRENEGNKAVFTTPP